MELAVILLLFTLLVVRKKPTKWKRVVFRLLAIACILYCLGAGFLGLMNVNLTDAQKQPAVIWNEDETYSTVYNDIYMSQADARTLLVKTAVGLVITIVSILLFREFRGAKSIFPVVLVSLFLGLGLAAVVALGDFNINRFIIYSITTVLLIATIMVAKRWFNSSNESETSFFKDILVAATCISIMLSVGQVANQYVIASRISAQQQQEWEQRVRTEHEMKKTLKYPNQSTISWNENGNGGTITAPNDSGVNVTTRFVVTENGNWSFVDP